MSIARINCYLSGASAQEETPSSADRAAAKTAVTLATHFAASLRFIHVSVDPLRAVPLLGEGMTGAMAARLTEDLTLSARESRAAAEALYQQITEEAGLPKLAEGETAPAGRFTVGLEIDEGVEEQLLAERARLADLTVIGQEGREAGESSLVLESLLFDSGRPVLLAPEDGLAVLPKRVAVAWNGSAMASRAVALSLPILKQAEEVIVISGEGSDAPTAAQPSAMASYLEQHGIKTATWRYQPDDWPVARSLVEETRKSGAGLLVMGAYGHSRMRELLLGGATRAAIKAHDLAVLMVH